VVELDGAYRSHAFRHAKIGDDEDFLTAAANVFKQRFLSNVESLNFAITALCKKPID
jgi:hypothetical protein